MKKSLRFLKSIPILAITILLLSLNVQVLATECGDVNNDGKITLSDFNMLKGYITKSVDFSGGNAAADVNNDGCINSLDLSYLKRYIQSQINSFPSKGYMFKKMLSDKVSYSVVTDDSTNSAIEITNTSNESVDFSMYMNGKSLFQSDNEVLAEIRSMPDKVSNEPIERKIWRFVRDNRSHLTPFTIYRWGHSPQLIFNSIGFGFCDDSAAVFCRLAECAGLQARVWALDGHVVPEVYVAGKWEMYDPDYGVYFKNRANEVAGLEELATDHTLITSPAERIDVPTGMTYYQYSEGYANLFSHNDKSVSDWYDTVIDIKDQRFNLVPGAKIKIGENAEPPILSLGVTAPTSSKGVSQYSQLGIIIPQGNNGAVINPPLVLQEVEGNGQFTVESMGDDSTISSFTFGTAELNDFINNINDSNKPEKYGRPYYIKSIKIISSDSPIEFVYLLNPLRFSVKDSNSIVMTGKGVDGLTAAIVPKSS
ncbi:MAG TPA: dockerin type I domain-containing protein [Clostridia bacterium]